MSLAPRCSRISRLVKESLTISHGNAVVERWFSDNTSVLSRQNEKIIQDIRLVK